MGYDVCVPTGLTVLRFVTLVIYSPIILTFLGFFKASRISSPTSFSVVSKAFIVRTVLVRFNYHIIFFAVLVSFICTRYTACNIFMDFFYGNSTGFLISLTVFLSFARWSALLAIHTIFMILQVSVLAQIILPALLALPTLTFIYFAPW